MRGPTCALLLLLLLSSSPARVTSRVAGAFANPSFLFILGDDIGALEGRWREENQGLKGQEQKATGSQLDVWRAAAKRREGRQLLRDLEGRTPTHTHEGLREALLRRV